MTLNTQRDEFVDVVVAFIPGEFNLSDAKHEVFVKRLLAFCVENEVDLVSGTEASKSPRNNTRELLLDLGPKSGYHVTSTPHGEWVAAAHKFGKVKSTKFTPVIPAKHGLASQGGHDVRGILTQTVEPHDERLGTTHHGVAHWLTSGVDPNTLRGHQNIVLEDEIGHWGKEAAQGKDIAFFSGDTNRDDQFKDAFDAKPFTSCWDELGKWPVTHPSNKAETKGPTLDLVASWDRDKRVSCHKAVVLDDHDLPLPVDHLVVLATYRVRVR